MSEKLFVDTANLNDISNFLSSYAVSGVTTNPSLVAKEEKKSYLDFVNDLVNTVRNSYTFLNTEFEGDPIHLSIEAISSDESQILDEAQRYPVHKGCIDLYVKIPVTLKNLKVISNLSVHGIKVNATCCMTALQAKMAQDAGADIVSFFYNRIKDGGKDPNYVLQDFCELKNDNVQIICGSIRKPQDVFNAWMNGSDIVTASPKVISEMIQHEQTDKAISQFEEDIRKWQS